MSYFDSNLVVGREVFYSIYKTNKDSFYDAIQILNSEHNDPSRRAKKAIRDTFKEALTDKKDLDHLMTYINYKIDGTEKRFNTFIDKVQNVTFKSFEDKMNWGTKEELERHRETTREKIIELAQKAHRERTYPTPKNPEEEEIINSNKKLNDEAFQQQIDFANDQACFYHAGAFHNLINSTIEFGTEKNRIEMEKYQKSLNSIEKRQHSLLFKTPMTNVVENYRTRKKEAEVQEALRSQQDQQIPPPPAYPLPPPPPNSFAPAYSPLPPAPVYVQSPPPVIYAREPQPKKSWSFWSLFTPVKYSLNLVTRFCSFCWSKMPKLFGR